MIALMTSETVIFKIMRGSIFSSFLKNQKQYNTKLCRNQVGGGQILCLAAFFKNNSYFLLTRRVECDKISDVIVDVGGIGVLRPSAENALENLPWSAEGARRRVAESLRPKDRAEKQFFSIFLFLLWEYFLGLPLRAVIFYF
jgi:hypothetical protein